MILLVSLVILLPYCIDGMIVYVKQSSFGGMMFTVDRLVRIE